MPVLFTRLHSVVLHNKAQHNVALQQVELPLALLFNMIQVAKRREATDIRRHHMPANGGSRGLPPLILDLDTTWGECLASSTNRFDPVKWVSSTHRVAGWVGPSSSLDALMKRKTTCRGLNLGSKASYYTDRATQAHRLHVLHIHYKRHMCTERHFSLDSWYVLQMREGLWGSQNNMCCPGGATSWKRVATIATRRKYKW